MVRFLAGAALGTAVGCYSSFASVQTQQAPCTAASSPVECSPAATRTTPFKPNEYTAFRLINSRFESGDTRRFIFALDKPDSEFYLPTASCIVVKFEEDGKEISRPYTPTSVNGTKGHFELLVKRYPKSKMGTHLFQMRPGETLDMKGPYVKLEYKANKWSHIAMIAGGTGITPMYQVIREVLANDKDKTRLSLVYGNNTRKDILMAAELVELQKTYDNFHMYLTLLEVPKKWLGGVGYITSTMLKPFLPKVGDSKSIILVCGPTPMMKAICGDKEYVAGQAPKQGALGGLLKEMGYAENQVFKF